MVLFSWIINHLALCMKTIQHVMLHSTQCTLHCYLHWSHNDVVTHWQQFATVIENHNLCYKKSGHPNLAQKPATVRIKISNPAHFVRSCHMTNLCTSLYSLVLTSLHIKTEMMCLFWWQQDERFPDGIGVEGSMASSVICLPVVQTSGDLICMFTAYLYNYGSHRWSSHRY